MSIADEGVKKEAFSWIDLENFWNLNWGCFLGKQCGNVLKFFFNSHSIGSRNSISNIYAVDIDIDIFIYL